MQTLMVKSGSMYRKATPAEIAAVAGALALQSLNKNRPQFGSPTDSVAHLQTIFAGRDYESFAVLFLDSRHQLLEAIEMFRGTIDAASVYAREVVKECLWRGSSAVIVAHNHPSGSADPSEVDKAITRRLQQALALIDVRVLDHVIIANGGAWLSMSQNGLI